VGADVKTQQELDAYKVSRAAWIQWAAENLASMVRQARTPEAAETVVKNALRSALVTGYTDGRAVGRRSSVVSPDEAYAQRRRT
jgi:hypothetical protein